MTTLDLSKPSAYCSSTAPRAAERRSLHSPRGKKKLLGCLLQICPLGNVLAGAFLFFLGTTTNLEAGAVQVIAWGRNDYGACNVPSDLTNVVSLSAASGHNLAVRGNGTIAAWGSNGNPVPGLNGVKAVCDRTLLSLALLTNGTVVAWGGNYYGGTDVPPGLANVTAIAAGWYHGLALRSDGTVVGWGGQDGAGVVPSGLTGVVAIAGGMSHSLALKNDGTVVAWGWNNLGQASVPSGLNGVVAISAGDYHSVALRNDGTVVVWGGEGASIQPPPGLAGVVAISAGSFHNLALRSNGTVVAWGGDNYYGEANVPAGLKDVVAISAGGQHSVAVSSSQVPLIITQPQSAVANAGGSAAFNVGAQGPGTLSYQWLKDGSLLPGATSTNLALMNLGPTDNGNYAAVVSNFAGAITSSWVSLTVQGLTTGGALVKLSGADVPGGVTDVIAAQACSSFALAIKADRTVIGWGSSPGSVVPANLSNVVSIAVGGDGFSLALRGDGTVAGWGATSGATVPAGLSNITAIAAGNARGYAVRADGSIATWGGGFQPPALSHVIAVSGAFDSGLALRSDGTAISWGNSGTGIFSGETNLVAISLGGSWIGGTYPLGLRSDSTVAGGGVPAGLSGVTAISSGGAYGLALKTDGTVVGLGSASLSAPVGHVTAIAANGGYGMVITRWPVITGQPQSVTNQLGSTAAFNAVVRGAGPFGYQWRKNGTNISGATGSGYVLNNVQTSDAAAYALVASNVSGSVTSSPAILSIFGAPQITLQPTSQTVFTSARVSFGIAALGADPLSYQWYHGTTPVPGGIGSNLVIATTAPADAGTYTAVVTNSIGAVTSSPAMLILTAPPIWQRSPPGTVVALSGPTLPPGLTNVVAVSAGDAHGLALRNDGTVAAWGRTFFDEATVPPGLSNVIAISAGASHSLALQADGTVVSWGWGGPAVPAGLFGIVAIAGGEQMSYALKSDGTVLHWGSPTTLPNSLTNITAIGAADLDNGIALRQNASVVTWGLINPGGINPTGLSNIVAISIGNSGTLALRSDGTVAGAGVPTNLTGVVAIAGGSGYGLALKTNGTVVSFGTATVPTNLTGVSAISARAFGLVITTNPPPPVLAGAMVNSGAISLTSPVSVPGYVLEASAGPGLPYSEIPAYTNSFTFTNASNPGFQPAVGGSLKFFRLRKQ